MTSDDMAFLDDYIIFFIMVPLFAGGFITTFIRGQLTASWLNWTFCMWGLIVLVAVIAFFISQAPLMMGVFFVVLWTWVGGLVKFMF